MLLMTVLTAVLTTAPNVRDLVDGAEIGTAGGYVFFETGGKYSAQKIDKARGNTTLKGGWTLKGELLEVKPTSCKGPACKELNKPYKAEVSAAAERALLVKAIPADAMLPSGSYYCHYLGCEPRVGIEVLSKNATPRSAIYVLDTLIDRNKGRNTTIVWRGPKLSEDVKSSRLEYCRRDEARAKKGAEEAAADLAGLTGWVGKLEPQPSADASCLWDVRVFVADTATPPARTR